MDEAGRSVIASNERPLYLTRSDGGSLEGLGHRHDLFSLAFAKNRGGEKRIAFSR